MNQAHQKPNRERKKEAAAIVKQKKEEKPCGITSDCGNHKRFFFEKKKHTGL
jgi:hypothetical protein